MKKMILAVVVFLVFGMMLAAPVFCKERGMTTSEMRMLDTYEREYQNRAREVLAEHILDNSGINMTKTIREDGQVEYTVGIYHEKITHMTGAQKEKLQAELEQIPFGERQVKIAYEFL